MDRRAPAGTSSQWLPGRTRRRRRIRRNSTDTSTSGNSGFQPLEPALWLSRCAGDIKPIRTPIYPAVPTARLTKLAASVAKLGLRVAGA